MARSKKNQAPEKVKKPVSNGKKVVVPPSQKSVIVVEASGATHSVAMKNLGRKLSQNAKFRSGDVRLVRFGRLGNSESINTAPVIPTVGSQYPGESNLPMVSHKAGLKPWSSGESVIQDNTQVSVFAMLEPWAAFAYGMRPKGIDGALVLRPTYCFATKIVRNHASILNVFTGTNDIAAITTNCILEHFLDVSAFVAGTGTIQTVVPTDDPVISAMSGVNDYRMVACGSQIYNTTPLDTQAGMIIQGRTSLGNALFPSTTNWGSFAGSGDFNTRGLGVPGDVGLLAWYPRMDGNRNDNKAEGLDYEFVPISYTSDLSSTSTLFWSQSPQPHTLTVVTYSFYEALMLPQSERFTPPSLGPCDSALAMRMVVSAFNAMPPTAIQRNVCKDDGTTESFVNDIKNVVGGVKGIIGTVKSAWSAFTNLFSATNEEKVIRASLNLDSEAFDYLSRIVAQEGDFDRALKFVAVSCNAEYRRRRMRNRFGSDLRLLRDALSLAGPEDSDEKSSESDYVGVRRRVVGSGSMSSAATPTPQNTPASRLTLIR